jgi:opacity protein-like surface antigen
MTASPSQELVMSTPLDRPIRVAAAAATAFALGCSPVAAQGMFQATDYYVKGFGGFSFPSDERARFSGSASGSGDARLEDGWAIGGAFGAMFTPNVAAELELAYRTADIDRIGPSGDRLGRGGESRSTAFMLNAFYVADGLGGMTAIAPYIGGGLGAARQEFNISGGDLRGDYDEDWILAYQAIAGIGYDVSPTVNLFGEIRYFGLDEVTLRGPSRQNVRYDYETVDVLFGAKFTF